MDLLQSILLGVIQGFTEFLPVSSSGHLVIFQKWLGVKDHSIAFDVAAHLGTLGAVLTVYRQSLLQVTKEIFCYPQNRKMTPAVWLFVVTFIGSIPTAIIGLTLKDQFESLFSNIPAVAFFFMITATILYFTDRISEGRGQKADFNNLDNIKTISISKAIYIGVAQGFAIAPGISRSGSTIASALYLGVERQTAALFSFMLAIPAVLGAAVLQLKDLTTMNSDVLASLGIGFVTAYFSGLVGLLGLLYIVRLGKMRVFSMYLWILGASLLFFAL